jgi:hypothetical protein
MEDARAQILVLVTCKWELCSARKKKQAVHVCHNLSEKQKNEGKRKRGKGEKNVLRMRKRRRTNEE